MISRATADKFVSEIEVNARLQVEIATIIWFD